MQKNTALKTGGTIFGIVALVHLIRVLAGWQLVIGNWTVPNWVSIVAFLVLGWLSYDFFKISKKK